MTRPFRRLSSYIIVFRYFLWMSGLFFFGSCQKILQLDNPETTNAAIYKEAWTVIDQRYALFKVKQVDWNAAFDIHKPAVGDTSESALFESVTSLLETLADGHVSLITPTKTYTYANFYLNFPGNFNYNNIVTRYLANTYLTAGPIIYTIRDSVGYIYYGSFQNNLSSQALDSVFSYMRGTKGLIVDVRNNLGGLSENLIKLTTRFVKQRMLMKYEQRKSGAGHFDFLEAEPFYLEPSSAPYTLPVCVLTNRSCFSACNDFSLFMSQFANVTIVGDHTGGGGGIPARYILANGWILQYTSTLTLDPDHQPIEAGILPDVKEAITTLQEDLGLDPILEKAFLMLR